jgi:flagellar hook-associated protein 3 FlgL
MLMRVATFALSDQMTASALRTQSIMANVQMQEASGVKSQDFADYGTDTQNVVNLQVSVTRAQTYIDASSLAGSKVQAMYAAVGQITDLITQFRSDLSAATTGTSTSSAAVISSAQNLLQEMGSLLNTQYNGEYLFAGARSTTVPVDLSTFATSGTGSLTTPDTSYYKGDGQVTSVQVSAGQTVNYGVTADNSAFEQTMRALKFVANSTSLSSSTISQASDLATSALDATSIVQAHLSNASSEIQAASAIQTDYKNYAQTLSGNLTGVDVAAVTAQLSTYQAQLQASYSAIAKIQGLSLASYVR